MGVLLICACRYVARISTALFTGSAIYCNLVEHPARLECGTQTALAQWQPSYKKAARYQLVFAFTASAGAIGSYFLDKDVRWLAAGLLIAAVIPYTFAAIMPTNKKLLDPNVDKDSAETKSLLEKWGKLHAVRSLLSFAALCIINSH